MPFSPHPPFMTGVRRARPQTSTASSTIRGRVLRTAAALVALAALTVLVAGPAAAQGATVDEGTFTVTRGGAAHGREEFRIVRQPGASAFTARATGAYGERRIAPALQADVDGLPERYQVEVRRGGAVEQRVTAQAEGTHFRARSQGESGEAAREFVLEPGTVVVDDELYHQYYFLLRRAGAAGAATRVPVLVPRLGTQRPLWITLEGTERVTVGGRTVAARHFTLTDRAGGRRDVWADAEGRVLRVVIPAQGVEAVRNDVPR